MVQIVLEKKIISEELIGRNKEYEVLNKRRRLCPMGNEFRYSDDYLEKLNELYPFKFIFGPKIKALKCGSSDVLSPIVNNSDIKDFEGEKVLEYMLTRSAQAELWQPWVINHVDFNEDKMLVIESYLESFKQITPEFGFRRYYENKTLISPSQKFVEHCSKFNSF